MSFQRSLTGESTLTATVILNTNVCANSVSTNYLSATNASFTNITTNSWTAGNVSTPNIIATDAYFSNLYVSNQTISSLNTSTLNISNLYASNSSITNLSTSFINASTVTAYITNTSTQNVCLVATSTIYSSYSYLDNASITNLSGTNITSSTVSTSYISVISISTLQTINGSTTLRIQNNGGLIVKDRDTSDAALIQLNYASTPSIETYGLYLEANKAYGRIGAGENCSLQFYADTVLQAENTSTTGWRFYNSINSSYINNFSNISVSSIFTNNLNLTTFSTSSINASTIVCTNISNFSSNTSYLYAFTGNMSELYVQDILSIQDVFLFKKSDGITILSSQNVSNISTKPIMTFDGFKIDQYAFNVSDNSTALFFYKNNISAFNSSLYISNISAFGVSTRSISCVSMYISNISVSNVSFINITGTSVRATSMTTSTVNCSTLTGITLNSSTLNSSTVNTCNVSLTNISISVASVSQLYVSKINFCEGTTYYGQIDPGPAFLYNIDGTNSTIATFSHTGNTKFAYTSNSISMYTSLYGSRAYFSTLNASTLNVSTFSPTTITTSTINTSTLNASTANISNASLFTIIGSTITVSTTTLNSSGTFNISVLNCSSSNISYTLPTDVNFSTMNASSSNICNISNTNLSSSVATITTLSGTSTTYTNISNSNLSISTALTIPNNVCCNVSNVSLVLHGLSTNNISSGIKVPNYIDGLDLTSGLFIGYNHTAGFVNFSRVVRSFNTLQIGGNLDQITATSDLGIGQNLTSGDLLLGNSTMTGDVMVDGANCIFGCDIRSTWNTSDLIKNSTQQGSFYDTVTTMSVNKADTGQTYVFGPQNSNTSLSVLPVGLYLVSGSFRLKTNGGYNANITTANCGTAHGTVYNMGSGNTSRKSYQTLGAINTSGTTNETWTMGFTTVINMSLTGRYLGVYVAATAGQAATTGTITIAIDNVTVVKIA